MRTQESYASAGREGGKARAAIAKAKILEKFAHLDRDEAIHAAWVASAHASKIRAQRRKAKGLDGR
jgi:hypothetical protein